MLTVLSFILIGISGAGADDRINLAQYARIVEYSGDSPETIGAAELERGADGWEAWRGADGDYRIGIEWDEPRDITEVNIEFRHAIANREKIRVQYWQNHWPSSESGGWAKLDDPFHGRWVTAKGEWWAGDRDVSIAFAPYSEEKGDAKQAPFTYRRTYRLQFLLGKDDLPPVRYLRAYGPSAAAEATFDFRFTDQSDLKPPLSLSALNGDLFDEENKPADSRPAMKEPVSIRVRYARDDIETANRTIVTLRQADRPSVGMSFLPAEVVAYGIIRVPAMGIEILHHGSPKDLSTDYRPGASVFDRVTREGQQTFERARREIPELRKSLAEWDLFYFPMGPPDARQEIAIRYDGSIFLQKSALKSKAADSDRLQWPSDDWLVRLQTGDPPFNAMAEGAVRQQLVDGFLPIVVNSWQDKGISYEQVNLVTLLDEEPRELRGDETVFLASRLTATNMGSAPADVIVRMTVEPHDRKAPGSRREILGIAGDHIFAQGMVTNSNVTRYDQPRYRLRLTTSGITPILEEQPDAAKDTVIRLNHRLKPGESAAFEWRVPFVTLDTPRERQRISEVTFDKLLARETNRWRKLLSQGSTVIEVPDPLLNDFYKAQLAHVLITADRDPQTGMRVLPAGTHRYNVCLNEACHQIRSLEVRGLHTPAVQFLDAILQGQSSRGLHGRFLDKTGVLHGLPTQDGDYQTFNYNLDHGFALWMLNEHFRFTRDKRWLEQHAAALIAACDFITRARSTPPESNLLGKDDEAWGVGLLPPGHLEDPPEWLWWFAVNAYAYRGMQATAESLAEVNHRQAVRIAADAKAFGDDLRRSCREAMLRAPVVRLRDGTHVPFQPTRSRLRGRDLGWIRDALYGPIHLIDCGIYAADSNEAEWILRDAEDNVFIGSERGRKLDDYERQWFSWGGITLQSNLLPNPLVYLRRGEANHAIRAFYNSLAANVFADLRTFCEHPIAAYGIARGPFFKPPDESAFIVWLRHLLISEEGKTLNLLAGVPEEWLDGRGAIKVKAAPTWFGLMDLTADSAGKGRDVRLEINPPKRNPPEVIRLRIPRQEPIRAVELNGRRLDSFDAGKGTIELPGKLGQAAITVSY